MVLFRQHPIRAYADTTVFGGIVDVKFEPASRAFFEEVIRGGFTLVIAPPVRNEIIGAPVEVRELFEAMQVYAEPVSVSAEAEALRRAYLDARILAAKSATDALHVAVATVNACELIVSWNFAPIVRESKILRFNAVNVSRGYNHVAIKSPPEARNDKGKTV